MRIALAALFIPLLISMNPPNVNGQDWRQIVPLKSTRAEVERLLGTTSGAYYAQYKLKQGSLFIEYSSGPCRPERMGGWNVPRDVVITLSFTPKRKMRLAALKLDRRKYKRVVDDHVIGILYYVNDEEGITYQVQSGKIDFVEYGPARRDEHLYCGDPVIEKARPVQEATNALYVPNWRELVVMRSTRAHVEKLPGRREGDGHFSSYKVQDGMLDVEYYPFDFCTGRNAYLKVRQWTVVEVTYEPDNPPTLTDLKLNLKKFRRVRESPHVPDMITYINDREGVAYTSQADNTLNDIRYFPAKRYDTLRCKSATTKLR